MLYISKSVEETIDIAAKLAKAFKKGETVALIGDLGAGKTVFTKGIAKGLGVKNARYVNSPTFVIIKEYKGKLPLYHFDLYRIESPDLLGMGYEEFFYGNGITAVEWSERLEMLLPKDHWHVVLEHAGDNKRAITLTVQGDALKGRFAKIKL